MFFCQLMAEERGLIVDVQGFNAAMDEARERSRNAQNKVFDHMLYDILSESVIMSLIGKYPYIKNGCSI